MPRVFAGVLLSAQVQQPENGPFFGVVSGQFEYDLFGAQRAETAASRNFRLP